MVNGESPITIRQAHSRRQRAGLGSQRVALGRPPNNLPLREILENNPIAGAAEVNFGHHIAVVP